MMKSRKDIEISDIEVTICQYKITVGM